MPDSAVPAATVAHLFMSHKGYPDLEPHRVIKLDDQPCWYFYYALSEGTLELEVFWDVDEQEWFRKVTAFPVENRP